MARARKKRFGDMSITMHRKSIERFKELGRTERRNADERLMDKKIIADHQREIELINESCRPISGTQYGFSWSVDKIAEVINEKLIGVRFNFTKSDDYPEVTLDFTNGKEIDIRAFVRANEGVLHLQVEGD